MRWFLFYFGRDWVRDRPWIFWLLLFPRRDLTRLGELVLAGLRIEIRPGRISIRSDVGEITTRVARLVGQLS